MGACASSQTQNQKRSSSSSIRAGERGSAAVAERIRRLSTNNNSSKVIDAVDGRLQEFRAPIQAKQITSKNPDCFLCSSETMSVGACVSRVPDDEDLQPGQIYFLLSDSRARKPLSLPDLCSLAIKASSVLGKSAVDFPSINPKVTEKFQ